jgi:hypothetical protein
VTPFRISRDELFRKVKESFPLESSAAQAVYFSTSDPRPVASSRYRKGAGDPGDREQSGGDLEHSVEVDARVSIQGYGKLLSSWPELK